MMIRKLSILALSFALATGVLAPRSAAAAPGAPYVLELVFERGTGNIVSARLFTSLDYFKPMTELTFWTQPTAAEVGSLVQSAEVEVVGMYAGPAGSASVIGGTSVGFLTIAGASVAIAVVGTIAIDCAIHEECIWTTVANAGGWAAVLGWSPSQAFAPIPGATTVNCSDATPLTMQCRRSSIRNSITSYDSWTFGSYWTCGQIWDDGSVGGGADWMTALATCNEQVLACAASTMAVCAQAGIDRDDDLDLLPAQPIAMPSE